MSTIRRAARKSFSDGRIRTGALVAALGFVAVACGGKPAASTPTSTTTTNASTTNPSPSGQSITGPAPGGSSSTSNQAVDMLHLSPTTAAAAGPVDKITWALYRDVNSLDPATAFDYPENTVVSTLCEALLRQQPDGSIVPGLATATYATPTSLVLNLQAGVTFWDGSPLTPADVLYSLNRQTDPNVAGFYANVFDRVSAIKQTGAMQVTITLKQPDYWLSGELSAMGGVIIEKKYAQAKGSKYGQPAGGAMCTGPFKLKSWVPGQAVVVVRNDAYWDKANAALPGEIDFKGVSDAAALTAGLRTGAIDGTYLSDTSTLAQLKQVSSVTVTAGPSFDTEYLIPANLKGVLGDVRVRKALSLAFDRQAYINTVYDGEALIPHLSANPGNWGFATSTFEDAWNAAPALTQDLAQAKQLIQEAGATGKSLVIGTSTGLATVQTEANAWAQAADAIGLKASLYNVSAANYINFFTDESARSHVDCFSTTTYGDYADPAALDSTYVLADGTQNFDGYNNPQITAALEKARAEADPTARAQDDIQAEKLIMQDLPWIPVADPANFVVMNKRITGAATSFAYMESPVLARVGSAQ